MGTVTNTDSWKSNMTNIVKCNICLDKCVMGSMYVISPNIQFQQTIQTPDSLTVRRPHVARDCCLILRYHLWEKGRGEGVRKNSAEGPPDNTISNLWLWGAGREDTYKKKCVSIYHLHRN